MEPISHTTPPAVQEYRKAAFPGVPHQEGKMFRGDWSHRAGAEELHFRLPQTMTATWHMHPDTYVPTPHGLFRD